MFAYLDVDAVPDVDVVVLVEGEKLSLVTGLSRRRPNFCVVYPNVGLQSPQQIKLGTQYCQPM